MSIVQDEDEGYDSSRELLPKTWSSVKLAGCLRPPCADASLRARALQANRNDTPPPRHPTSRNKKSSITSSPANVNGAQSPRRLLATTSLPSMSSLLTRKETPVFRFDNKEVAASTAHTTSRSDFGHGNLFQLEHSIDELVPKNSCMDHHVTVLQDSVVRLDLDEHFAEAFDMQMKNNIMLTSNPLCSTYASETKEEDEEEDALFSSLLDAAIFSSRKSHRIRSMSNNKRL